MKSKLKRALTLILSSIILFSSCGTDNNAKQADATVDLNETKTFFVGVKNTNDTTGNINPLYINENNSDIAYAMNSRLVMTNESGEIVAGKDYPTIAKDYTVHFVNENNEVHEEYEDGDRALYTFLIKPNLMFSDGSKITADDVLFTLYTLLDPQYNGQLGFSSLPVEGLSVYSRQMTPEIEEAYLELCEEFLENGEKYDYEDEDKNKLSTAFWTEVLPIAGEKYCDFAVKYVNDNYLTDDYIKRYLSEDLTAEDVQNSQTLKIAYAMIVWEAGEFNENGKFQLSNREVDIKNGDTLSLSDFWNELYLKKNQNLEKVDDDAAGDNTVSSIATTLFVEKYGPSAMEEKITEISGISKGELLSDGEVVQTVSVTLSDYSPEYLSKMTIPVISKSYYTSGYEYSLEKTQSFGVELNSPQFMAHIKNNELPEISSGAYKPSVGPLGGFYEDGVWYFVRNDNFKSLGVHNANIKNVAFVKTTEGEEYSHFEGGFLNAVSFTPDLTTAETISNNEKIGTLEVLANAYGYILINPRHYPDLNERIAIASLFDPSLAVAYYPENTAQTLVRSQAKNSFAYPQNATAIYSYNSDDSAVKTLFETAGYEFEEKDGSLKMTDSNGERAKFVFTLPKDADSHPAGAVFKNAVSRLQGLGALAEIEVNENLTETIRSDAGVAIYAMGRKLTNDPDSRHIYDHKSVNDTTRANGITWLWENGESDDLGEIEIEDKTYTQDKALDEVSDILNEAAYLTDYASREELYNEALDIIAKLGIEITLYQRNSLFVYDEAVLDVSEIKGTCGFYTPTEQLWKLKFLN